MSDASVSREECEAYLGDAVGTKHEIDVFLKRLARAHLELLAEVEALRRDKERLDLVLEDGCITQGDRRRYFKTREAIDAAMLPDPPEVTRAKECGVDPATAPTSADDTSAEAKTE